MSGSLILIGLSGSGKSTIGRAVATRCGVQFFDSDRMIEDTHGRSVARIFQDDGEPMFRRFEYEALITACNRTAVVATGGGAILNPDNRQLLRDGNLVVWLDPPLAALIQRLSHHASGEKRPLLVGGLESRLQMLDQQRRPFYAETAHLRIGPSRLRGADVSSAAKFVAQLYRDWQSGLLVPLGPVSLCESESDQ